MPDSKRGASYLASAIVVIASGSNVYTANGSAQDLREIRVDVQELVQGKALLNWRVSQLEKDNGSGT